MPKQKYELNLDEKKAFPPLDRVQGKRGGASVRRSSHQRVEKYNAKCPGEPQKKNTNFKERLSTRNKFQSVQVMLGKEMILV